METLVYLSLTVALIYLGRIGFLIYEAWQMDFNFERPWPEDRSIDRLKEKLKKVNPNFPTIEVNETDGKLVVRKVVRA